MAEYDSPTTNLADPQGDSAAAIAANAKYWGQNVPRQYANGVTYGLNPDTGQWEPMYRNTTGAADGSYNPFDPSSGVPLEDSRSKGGNSFWDKTVMPLLGPGFAAFGFGSGLAGLAGAGGGAGLTAADANTLSGLAEGAGATTAPAAAGVANVGGGLAVDEFGNVVGAGAGGGSTGIGSGLGVDAYGNVSGGAAATGGTGTGTAAGGTAISRILNGTATGADYASVLGAAAPAALGAYASTQQTNALQGLANQYMALGAPSRARYEQSFQPGFSMTSDPGYQDALDQSAKGTLHALSTQGNPAGSPNAWAASLQDLYSKTAYPALQNYRSGNASAGGLQSLTAAAPSTATAAIGSNANFYNAIGGGIADVFTPRSSLSDLLKGLRYA